jgi:hypothetical protein
MRHAKCELTGTAGFASDESAKALVAIDLEGAAKILQMARMVHTLAILAVEAGDCRMSRTFPRPIINRITPKPSGLGATTAGVQHRQSGIGGEHLGRRQHGLQHQFVQRVQPPAGAAYPIAQCRAVQNHRLTGEDLRLTVRCCAPYYAAETPILP